MGSCFDLEVDVNGEEIFFITKLVLAYFCCKFTNMFAKSRSKTNRRKVILYDFPGGAKGFELILRYCYNDGKIEINPSNVISLHCSANFMEMRNLMDLAKKYMEKICFWTWSQLLSSLKQCEDLYAAINSRFLEKYLDSFVGRISLLNFASPYTYSSSEISNSQVLSETSSSSVNSYSYQATWWFKDLNFVNIVLFEKLVRVMISQRVDHMMIFKFIICYRRCKFVNALTSKKLEIVEVVIGLLSLLDRCSSSGKGIFEIFRVALCFEISKTCKKKLEALVGSKLDEATIDDLLIPSPQGKQYMYDVNMILRLLRLSSEKYDFPLHKLKKINGLLLLYLIEVAPDPKLKPYKFVKLVKVISKISEDCHDKIYLAVDIYLKVHCSLGEDEKMEIASLLNTCGVKIMSELPVGIAITMKNVDHVNAFSSLSQCNSVS